MLSYQHIYHAGNFSDAHKHAVLCMLIDRLKTKPKPFAVIDTHAGRGFYDLDSAEAQKTPEFNDGIVRVLQSTSLTPGLQAYAQAVRGYNNTAPSDENQKTVLRYYPGSPRLTRDHLRAGDDLILAEKHPQEFAALQQHFQDEPGVHLHHRDGYEMLKALVPLPQRRGLVLIDPSYEIKSEYQEMVSHLRKAYTKWPSAVYMIWYPLLPAGLHREMLAKMHEQGFKNVLVSEIRVKPNADRGMYGSGVAIINPPFQFEQTLQTEMAALTKVLAQIGSGARRLFWLDNQAIDPDTGVFES